MSNRVKNGRNKVTSCCWSPNVLCSCVVFLLLLVLVLEKVEKHAVDVEHRGPREDPLNIGYAIVEHSGGLVLSDSK